MVIGEDVASIVFFDAVVVRYGLLPLIMGGVVVDLLPWLRLLRSAGGAVAHTSSKKGRFLLPHLVSMFSALRHCW
jgi:hypothetical protein